MHEDFPLPGAPPLPHRKLNKAQVHYLFPMIDSNKDGQLSLEELQTFDLDTEKRQALKDFKPPGGADADKDGTVTLEELEKDIGKYLKGKAAAEELGIQKKRFGIADTDKDGKLAGEELVAFFLPNLDVNHELALLEVEPMLTPKDTDKDGKLSPAEFKDKEGFAEADANKDGFVCLDELFTWTSGLQEFKADMEQLLKVADKDGNGQASLEEIVAARGALTKMSANVHLLSWARKHEEL